MSDVPLTPDDVKRLVDKCAEQQAEIDRLKAELEEANSDADRCIRCGFMPELCRCVAYSTEPNYRQAAERPEETP